MGVEFLVFLFAALPATFSARKSIDYESVRDGLQTASGYAKDFTAGISSSNVLGTFQSVLNLAGTIHPVLGAFAGGLSLLTSFFQKPTENPLAVALREGFAEVSRLLDRNLNALKDVKYELQREVRGLSLESQIDDIESVVLFYDAFIQNPDNLSRNDFLTVCLDSRVLEKPLWFMNALTSKNPSNLKHLFLERGEQQKYNSYVQQIMSLFFSSTLMSSACTAIYYRNEDEETVKMYIDRRAAEAEGYLRQILEALERDIQFFSKYFVQFAFNDVERCAKNEAEFNNEAAARCIDRELKAKYDRNFFALVYGDKEVLGEADSYYYPTENNVLLEKHNGTCDSYARTFRNFYSRNYAVCFQDQCSSETWKKSAIGTVSGIQVDPEKNCVDYVKLLAGRASYRKLEYNLLGCFRRPYEVAFSTKVNTITATFNSKKRFTVFICK